MAYGASSLYQNWDWQLDWQPIFSLFISCLSILYGISTYNLRKILRNESNIRKILQFTFTELITSIVIFLYIQIACPVFVSLFSGYHFLTVIPIVLSVIIIPILGAHQLSVKMLGLNAGYRSVDYRINLSLKCQELGSLTAMMRCRKMLVILNMVYVLVTCSALTIALYWLNKIQSCIMPFFNFSCENYGEHVVMVLILVWYTACILSFLQNTLELLFILIAKKSFLDWAFKEALEKQEIPERFRAQERHDTLELISYNIINLT